MADLPERDAALFLDMLLAARDAKAFIEGLGEAAGRVSAVTRAGHPNIPWREITGMRHRLIHGYGEVRLDLVWTVLRDRLDPLITTLVALVPDNGNADA
jgi:uncharacterized protein with HEPN domain